MEEYGLYIDDSGSPKPKVEETPHFAMGGVLIKRQDIPAIEEYVRQFKTRWNIPQDIPLHGNRIRSKKATFAWLGTLETSEFERFHQELADMVVRCPVVVHACVISRSGYRQRYLERYGDETWDMMRTAFFILIERAAKFVAKHHGKLMVYPERGGKREDRMLRACFEEMRTQGHPFDPSNAAKYNPLPQEELARILSGMQIKSKKLPQLQIADLCLYPVAQAKTQPGNRAHHAMLEAGLLVDSHLLPEEVAEMGIKYSCFDT